MDKAKIEKWLDQELSRTSFCGFYDLYPRDREDLMKATLEGLKNGLSIREIVRDWQLS